MKKEHVQHYFRLVISFFFMCVGIFVYYVTKNFVLAVITSLLISIVFTYMSRKDKMFK